MQRLRHPVRAIREPFGTAGLVIAMVALVAALGGTALAASGALTGKQKKEVEKIAKKFAGKPGAPGAPGAQGAAGSNGAAGKEGPKGADGTNGTDGTDGTNGTNGTSVTASPTSGNECEGRGGSKFQVGSGPVTRACNGETGFTETLPSEATETGTWGFGVFQYHEGEEENPGESPNPTGAEVPISFPIPLAAPLEGRGCYVTEQGGPFIGPCHVHYINRVNESANEPPVITGGMELVRNTEAFDTEEQPSLACTGTVWEPTAAPGNLCIYTATESDMIAVDTSIVNFAAQTPGHAAASSEIGGASTSGAIFQVGNQNHAPPFGVSTAHDGSEFLGTGTWAVTAP